MWHSIVHTHYLRRAGMTAPPVFHGMVYAHLNQNPLIVPLEILRGHTSSDGRGEYYEYARITFTSRFRCHGRIILFFTFAK